MKLHIIFNSYTKTTTLNSNFLIVFWMPLMLRCTAININVLFNMALMHQCKYLDEMRFRSNGTVPDNNVSTANWTGKSPFSFLLL